MIDLATTRRQTLTIDELMTVLDVSRRTVYRWIARGYIRSTRVRRPTAVVARIRIPIDEARRLYTRPPVRYSHQNEPVIVGPHASPATHVTARTVTRQP